ncbi:adenylyltransferase/cytidyltransferase family protein [Candidatus Altiarchaeota archaeon]
MKGLVVGRFQPLHYGHLHLIEYAASECDSLVVGVGSCNQSRTLDNPFTFGQRRKMIEDSLDIGVGFEVAGIPDFGDYDKWAAWIKSNLDFDVFFGNTGREAGIFGKAGVKVISPPFHDRERLNGTYIRGQLLAGSDLSDLVPAPALKVVTECGGQDLLRDIVESQ